MSGPPEDNWRIFCALEEVSEEENEDLWKKQISAVEDFMDEVQDRLDVLEEASWLTEEQ